MSNKRRYYVTQKRQVLVSAYDIKGATQVALEALNESFNGKASIEDVGSTIEPAKTITLNVYEAN